MTKADVQAILDEADDNGDGRLDYREVGSAFLIQQSQWWQHLIQHTCTSNIILLGVNVGNIWIGTYTVTYYRDVFGDVGLIVLILLIGVRFNFVRKMYPEFLKCSQIWPLLNAYAQILADSLQCLDQMLETFFAVPQK